MENLAEKFTEETIEKKWAKWGTKDGRIGYLPDFVCIEPKYSRIYWDAFWDAYFSKRLG